jgi:hypothetical protein
VRVVRQSSVAPGHEAEETKGVGPVDNLVSSDCFGQCQWDPIDDRVYCCVRRSSAQVRLIAVIRVRIWDFFWLGKYKEGLRL